MEEDIRPSALQLPEDLTIVGVGGCGKNLAYEVCKHEWILKHYLSESGRHLRIYIIAVSYTHLTLPTTERV